MAAFAPATQCPNDALQLHERGPYDYHQFEDSTDFADAFHKDVVAAIGREGLVRTSENKKWIEATPEGLDWLSAQEQRS